VEHDDAPFPASGMSGDPAPRDLEPA